MRKSTRKRTWKYARKSTGRQFKFFDDNHLKYAYVNLGEIEYNQENNEIKTFVYIGDETFSSSKLTFRIMGEKAKCGQNGCTHLAVVVDNPCQQQIWWLPVYSRVIVKLDIYNLNKFSDEKFKFDIIRTQLNGEQLIVKQYGLFWEKSQEKNMKNIFKLFQLKSVSNDKLCLFQIMEYFEGIPAIELLDKYGGDILRSNLEIYNKIGIDICKKIDKLHALGFAHGDIHLYNILINEKMLLDETLVTDNATRLIDLGALKRIRPSDNPWKIEFEGGSENIFKFDPKNPYYWPPWKRTYDLCERVHKLKKIKLI